LKKEDAIEAERIVDEQPIERGQVDNIDEMHSTIW
jgi:hypothetical protein